MSVAALMAAMLAVTAVPAFATIHGLTNMTKANDNASPVVQVQDPPGPSAGLPSTCTGPEAGCLAPKNPNQSNRSAKLNKDGFLGNLAQPLFVANENAFKPKPEPKG